MTDKILWGRHPDYAHGEWIKLARDVGKRERNERTKQGFELVELPFLVHPEEVKDEQGEIRIYVACLAAYNNGICMGAGSTRHKTKSISASAFGQCC